MTSGYQQRIGAVWNSVRIAACRCLYHFPTFLCFSICLSPQAKHLRFITSHTSKSTASNTTFAPSLHNTAAAPILSNSMASMTPKEKLNAIRLLMDQHSVDAYIVYSADAHGSEYPSEHDCRVKFITEFTGSAGTALILAEEALLWTDGRYFTQAEKELDNDLWTLMKAGTPDTPTIPQWIEKTQKVSRLGIDPNCISVMDHKKLCDSLRNSTVIVPVVPNLVDLVWGDGQPPQPSNKVFPHSQQYTGVSSSKKVEDVRNEMKKESADILVVPVLDEIAWLLNLRGSDLDIDPVFYAYLMIGREFVKLYINKEQLGDAALGALEDLKAEIRPYDAVISDISGLFTDSSNKPKVWMDNASNLALYSAVPDAESNVVLQSSPIVLAKSIKNTAELEGMRQAHIKDGVAMVKFLAWSHENKESGDLFGMTEVDLANKVDQLRSEQEGFFSLSFPAISGIGPNGAIIHYRPEEGSCSILSPSMYLLDSGGQYLDGTTDITRTIHFGIPSQYEKEMWTRVLKGHIELARAVFPHGTKGPQLDVLARRFLWKKGLDYAHGTGHGVGSFLNVHEGPCGIHSSLAHAAARTNLVPGMVLSNEPGFYSVGHFGVRIESLVAVRHAPDIEEKSDIKFYDFETITLVPLSKELIDFSLITSEEIEWLNEYHQKIYNVIGNKLREEEKNKFVDNQRVLQWLANATSPISV